MSICISTYYVEQNRRDTSRVVHYAGGSLKYAKKKAEELSNTCGMNAAWIVKGRKGILKYFRGKQYKPSDTV